ncbi:PHD and RING finger domain-containing protein 1 isoform X3 [Nematostella vectensis]|uniref:PHD and RING finger domain-containing protein 1 isoform X2 n=1 Tax=Nematostella vectensis TaxID=45351 RepID=UPI00138FD80E|nr:PHD and RING finger domain-containing protein 1 isoform X2 [Nematostella vectensis]XP_032222511.1 PHD and RING finger domain-containing protein 1 isoform X3 [Nematostella vectensis]
MANMESDSDLDYTQRKKFRRRIVNDDSTSDDYDDDSDDNNKLTPANTSRGKRKAHIAFESDEEESSEEFDVDDVGSDDDDDEVPDVNISDNDDATMSNSAQCPVCLMSLSEQKLGTPNSCMHVFCLECILEWSKNAVTCPVDRKEFSEIIVHSTKKGPILHRIPVEKVIEEEEWEDEPTYCEVCHDCDREDRLLLCDDCDKGYHMECLTSPLEFVPIEEWFCPICRPHGTEESGDEEGRRRGLRTRPSPSTASSANETNESGRTTHARTAASARGRGNRRGRTGTRSSTRGRSRSTATSRGRTRTRTSTRGRSHTSSREGTRSRSTRGRKTKSKNRRTKSSSKRKPRKKRRTKKSSTRRVKRARFEEDSYVNPFEGPARRGRTVKERLNEGLRGSGSGTDMGRIVSNCPFPSRLEPTLSFSLFGNSYSLEVSDSYDDRIADGDTVNTGCFQSGESSDVLGSILDGIEVLNDKHVTISRDGRVVKLNSHDLKSSRSSENSERRLLDRDSDIIRTLERKRVVSRDPTKVKALEILAAERAKRRTAFLQNDNIDFYECNDRLDCKKMKTEVRVRDSPEDDDYSFAHAHRFERRSVQSSRGTHREKTKPRPPLTFKSRFRIPKKNSSLQSATVKEKDSSKLLSSATANLKDHSSSSSEKKELTKNQSNSITKNSAIKTLTTDSSNPGTKVNAMSGSVPSFRTITDNGKSVLKAGVSIPKPEPIERSMSYLEVEKEKTDSTEHRKKLGALPKTITHTKNQSPSFSGTITHTKNQSPSFSGTITHTKNQSALGPGIITYDKSTGATGSTPKHLARLKSDVKVKQEKHDREGNNESSQPRQTCSSSPARSSESKTIVGSNNFDVEPSEVAKTCKVKTESVTELLGSRDQHSNNLAIIEMLRNRTCHMRALINPPPLPPLPNVRHPSSAPRNKEVQQSPKPRGHPETQVPQQPNILPPLNSYRAQSHASSTPLPVAVVLPTSSSSQGVQDSAGCSQNSADTQEKRDESRKKGIARLHFHKQVVDEVRSALRPFLRHKEISKDEYKNIFKRAVDKIKESNHQVDRGRVASLIKKYVKKIKGQRCQPSN